MRYYTYFAPDHVIQFEGWRAVLRCWWLRRRHKVEMLLRGKAYCTDHPKDKPRSYRLALSHKQVESLRTLKGG